MNINKAIMVIVIAAMCALPSCTTHDPQVYESRLASFGRNYVPLPDGWAEVFTNPPEGNTFKGEAFGPEKVIKYYISKESPEFYWVQLHERGHALQWKTFLDMYHCSNKCVMSKRNTVSQVDVYAASINRGGKWFCDKCRKELGIK